MRDKSAPQVAAPTLCLARHFIAHYSQQLNQRVQGVTPKAEVLLESYNWPGNIRELRNVIERAVILCSGDRIHARDLPLGGSEPWEAGPPDQDEEFLSLDEVERISFLQPQPDRSQ